MIAGTIVGITWKNPEAPAAVALSVVRLLVRPRRYGKAAPDYVELFVDLRMLDDPSMIANMNLGDNVWTQAGYVYRSTAGVGEKDIRLRQLYGWNGVPMAKI